MIILLIILAVVVLFFLSGIRIINEWDQGLVFTFGKYSKNKSAGLNWIIPIVQTMKKVDMRVRTLDVEPQECITKDSVTVGLDAVVYFKVIDSMKSIIKVKDFVQASYKLV